MKFIVAGSRHIKEVIAYGELVKLRISKDHPFSRGKVTEIVSGCANGPDSAGEVYGKFYDIPIKKFPAEWDKYGKRAGPIRNNKMAAYADALLLIWDGKSSGSRHMKQAMLELHKPVYEIILETDETD
jgi:hypothetical protein